MKKSKKLVSLLLISAMLLVGSISSFASDYLPPEGLPENAVKVKDGIYVVTSEIAIFNETWTNIGDVPVRGYIIQPSAFNNVQIHQNENWLKVQASDAILVNFVGNGQSIFGPNLSDWPQVGGTMSQTYYIDGAYFGMQYNIGYQLQCTSINSLVRRNVELRIWTSPTT